MQEVRHRVVDTNGIRLALAECGPEDGPMVLCCHGFPESWYSWRHQLTHLGALGYRVVAPDMRGFGGSDAPHDVQAYDLAHLVGDMVGVLDALGVEQAVIAGHDWGAPVAWHGALWRPDRFRAVIVCSVPFTGRAAQPPLQRLRELVKDGGWHYQLFFQQQGVAEADLERDVGFTIRSFLHVGSGAFDPAHHRFGKLGADATFTDHLVDPGGPMSWISDDDVAFYVDAFTRTGFRGGLNWYRNIDRNWELTAPWAGARITVPALFIAGARDGVLLAHPGWQEVMPQLVPQLCDVVLLDGCGHWTQQERPDEVSDAMAKMLASL